MDYLTQFSNALSTSTPGGTATGATAIQIVPATDPVRAGPLTAAYLDGSSSITFPSGNEYLDLQLFGTISILFQSNQASQTAVVVGYNGKNLSHFYEVWSSNTEKSNFFQQL